jgi:hypothetical protein
VGGLVEGFQLEGQIIVIDGLAVVAFLLVNTADIEQRIVTRLVIGGRQRFFQPGQGFIQAAQFNQVGTDVVVGIAKVGSSSIAC